MPETYERFGKYLLLEKIATGGMAEVYLARSTGASGITKFVAIKRILPQFSDNPEFIDMFKDEAKIAINLSHGNIVSIYEFGVEKGQFFLVMDYVEGKNLRQILNKMKKSNSALSIDQIVYIIKEVAAGLDHAHRCLDGTTGRPLNITHRDMSPQNIMVSFEGEIKIVDFGIAKAESQLETTKAGTLKGKFGYMSPEQAEGLPVDLRTDIFSLGIVLWELLANDRLFIANNEVNTLRKIRECNIPSLRKINPGIPQELEKIVNKSLARDRNLRYQTAAAFHKDLNRFLNRQYPDFSPQDFSIFSKTLFANEILDNRKRLIEYAKLPLDKISSDRYDNEMTQVTQTNTNQGFFQSTSTQQEPTQMQSWPNDSNPNTNFTPTVDSVSSPSLAPMETPAPVPEPVKPSRKSTQSELQLIRPRERTRTNVESQTRTSYHDHHADLRGALRYRRRANFLVRVLTNNVFLFVAVLGGSLYYESQQRPALTHQIHQSAQNFVQAFNQAVNPLDSHEVEYGSHAAKPGQTNGNPNAPNTDQSEAEDSAEMYTILVTSRPAAAEIYIDGRDTGVLTPGTVRVEAHKPFTLGIRNDGYLTFSQTFVSQQNGQKFQATLIPAKLGYLDISVIPPTAIVFVNGQKVPQSPPINRFAVPADTEIIVRAEIPLTHASDEVRVTVHQDLVKKVQLFPRSRGISSER